MPERSDEVLLTYAELGDRLGVSSDGARMRAKRERWPHEERNDPKSPLRVRVPAGALPEHPPERSPKRSDSSPNFDERFAELAEQVDEIRSLLTRTSAEQTELRAELAEAKTRAAVAEARIEAERAAAEDRVATRNAVIEELRAMLADARRPWWRRLVGA
jgi:hypothetical protein